jgi:hypothetical protein
VDPGTTLLLLHYQSILPSDRGEGITNFV